MSVSHSSPGEYDCKPELFAHAESSDEEFLIHYAESSDEYAESSDEEFLIHYAFALVADPNGFPVEPDLAGHIMEALGDPNIYMIGLCGEDDDRMEHRLETIERRVKRDDLFGVIVVVSIGKKPNLTRIQQEIAHKLGFSYQEQEDRTPSSCVFRSGNENAITENARQLSDRIRALPTVLFILRDLHAGLDLAKLGIPFGVNHQGCKLILTSHSEQILSNRMNVQRIFMNC